jgi:hypothetical protein
MNSYKVLTKESIVMPKFYIESKDLQCVAHNENFIAASCWALKLFLNIKCSKDKPTTLKIGHYLIVTESGFVEGKSNKEKKEINYKERKKILKNISLSSKKETDSIVFIPTKELLEMIGYEVSLDEDNK